MRPPSKFPSPSIWLSELDEEDEVSVLNELPSSRCDFVIIGAGITGCSLAFHLSKLDPTLDIIVIESRNICGGASGRNGGISWPSRDEPFEMQTAAEMVELFQEHAVDVGYRKRGGVSLVEVDHVSSNEGDECEDLLDNVTRIDPVACLGASPYAFRAAYFDAVAASFWPAKFVRLLARASQPTAKYVIDCTAYNIGQDTEKDASGSNLITVDTSLGVLRSQHVVVATNGWVTQLLPELGLHFEAKINTVMCSRLPVANVSKRDSDTENPSLCSWDTLSALSCGDGGSEVYLSIRHDGRLIIGGLREVTHPSTTSQSYPINSDDFEDSSQQDVPAGHTNTVEALQSWLLDKFPHIASQCGGFSPAWCGMMGFPSDGMPIVGKVPMEGNDRCVYVVSACCGHGMPRCFGLAKILALQLQQVTLDDLQTETFSKFDVSRFFM